MMNKKNKQSSHQISDSFDSTEISFQELITDSPIGIYRTTPSGKILFANQALIEMMGFKSFEELSARNVDEHGYENQTYRKKFMEIMEKYGQVTGFESAWKKKDGTVMYIREYGRARHDAQGNIIAYEGTIEDITEKKKIEKVLKNSLSKLAHTFDELVESLSTAMNIRDPYTAGHQQRVSRLAVAISKEMGYSDGFCHVIKTAGTLHDIGKIYVPAEILARPGKLKDEEMALIKVHPTVGYEILKNVSFDQPIAEIIYQHHEKLNGTGYPRGLKGPEIMIEARILSVADIVEALASHRPYRPALKIETALTHINILKDNEMLDPTIVEVCHKLFLDQGFTLDIEE